MLFYTVLFDINFLMSKDLKAGRPGGSEPSRKMEGKYSK
jgi:hypothetical protein